MSRLALAFFCAVASAHAAPDFTREVLPLLEAHCFDCHGDETKPKGGVNLERFGTDAAAMADRAVWADVFNKVESHQMPPPKRDSQPTEVERKKLLTWIADIAARPDPKLGARDPGRAVLRRLTRLEYNNTVRDLFGLKLDIFAFPERLPVDKEYFVPASRKMGERLEIPVREFGLKYAVLLPDAGLPGGNRAEHGFHNRGEAMNLSPLLLEKYLALGKAITHSPKLAEQSAVFRALIADPSVPPRAVAKASSQPASDALASDAAPDFAPNLNVPNEARDGDVVTTTYQHRFAVRAAVAEGTAGVWDATSRTLVVNRGSPVRVKFGIDREKALVITSRQAMWIAGFSTATETSGESLFTNEVKGAKQLALALAVEGGQPGEGVAELGLCVLSRKGESGHVVVTVRFTDGRTARLRHQIPAGDGAGNTFFGFRAPVGQHIIELLLDGSQFSGSYVLADDLGFLTKRIEVPEEQGGAVLEMPARDRQRIVRERLGGFLAKAFRRPVEAREVERYAAVFSDAQKAGANFEAAMRAALGVALASPDFLYLAEAAQKGRAVRPITDHELANRLAYFLWAAPPDDDLRAAADEGRLRDEVVPQTRRMLSDPRVRELGESFAAQWLRLDQLFTAKPDPKLFKGFYSGQQGKITLHSPMLVEALLLFETVLVEDRSILDFVNADYTWLNPQLARLYGLEATLPAGALVKRPGDDSTLVTAKSNSAWWRVALPEKTRGGFITMGGPLTVTSLPFRTSPVKRGAWLLETIFNRPPQEPKIAFVLKDAEKPSAAAQSSVRQKFELHRSDPACFSCHIRLDPPGFALEAFDPIGARRTRDGKQLVDARAEWNGRAFDGPAGFKAALMEKPEEFVRGFIEHLLSYALGRKLEIYDLPAVQEIQSAAAKDGYRFGTIVTEIVASYPFRNVCEK